MRVGVKLLLVAAAVAAAGVLIGFYVSNLTTLAGSPAYSVPVQNVNGHPVVNLEIQTVAAVGPKLSPNPDWVSYLVQTRRAAVEARDGLGPAGERDRPRDDLQLRRRERPAQPVPRPAAGHGRQPDPRRRQADRPRSTRTTRRTRSRCRRSGSSSPHPGVADDAKNQCGYAPVPDVERAPRRSSSRSTRRRSPATSAGSASCPARPAGSTASAARCRRSATWTASST